MTHEARAFEILEAAYPSLNEDHFNIMKETLHPLWCQALAVAAAETSEEEISNLQEI